MFRKPLKALALAGLMVNAGCIWSPHLNWHSGRNAIPETYPLGSTVRAHLETMETNGEATDFILYRHEFRENTAELTPAGKDHILEIAARMRSTPFPVIIEREENNSDPELDLLRRNLITRVLTDSGNPDAPQRVVIAPAYGKGKNADEAEVDFYRFIYTRGFNGVGNFGAGSGLGVGFGGGGGIGGF